MESRMMIALLGVEALMVVGCGSSRAHPAGYQGRPYRDETEHGGPQSVPGRIQCAYYDRGGEGVAYHDLDAINHGSGELNLKPGHQRPQATPAIWGFRGDEGVDVSYAKDFADFNHPNLVAPETNQLYLGWTEDGEWCNYTVDVKQPGIYRIVALYGNAANEFTFSINGQPAARCRFPVATGSMHVWNKAETGVITFAQPGLQVLTLHYNKGNNIAYFDILPRAGP